MRNALELLRQKEFDLARLRKETEALRIAAPLLRDASDELAYAQEERGEQFDLQCTGTDGFHSSTRRVFAVSEWEVSCGQPFLMPKPPDPEPSFWDRLQEKKRTVLASLHKPVRRWWYGAVGVMLLFVAFSGYELGHWIGHRVLVTNSSARTIEASPRRTTSTEPTSDWTPIVASAQRQYENQSKPREAVAPAVRPIYLDASQALAGFAPLPGPTAFDTTGGIELSMGRRYIQGQGVAQDHTEAARWLWESVAKQNGDAALLLSDLFARGDGVPKSCEQARLLLTVAAVRSSKPGGQESVPSSNLCSPQ